jgi:hypothetical protein
MSYLPRACRFWKYQIENRSPELPRPTFFKTWFKFIKCSYNWSTLTDFQTFCGYFYVFLVVEHIPDILRTNTVKNETFSKKTKIFNFCQFLPVFASFSHFLWTKHHVLKKVGRSARKKRLLILDISDLSTDHLLNTRNFQKMILFSF